MNIIHIIGHTSPELDQFERMKRTLDHITIMLVINLALLGVTLGMTLALAIVDWKH